MEQPFFVLILSADEEPHRVVEINNNKPTVLNNYPFNLSGLDYEDALIILEYLLRHLLNADRVAYFDLNNVCNKLSNQDLMDRRWRRVQGFLRCLPQQHLHPNQSRVLVTQKLLRMHDTCFICHVPVSVLGIIKPSIPHPKG